VLLPHCVHTSGPIYHFVQGGDVKPWAWQEMVAHLTTASLHKIFEGLQGEVPQSRMDPNRAIIGCKIQETPVHDHKRHAALHQGKGDGTNVAMLMVWDFVLMRADGSTVYIHPNYGSTKIACKELSHGETLSIDFGIPSSGKGGEGAYKWFKDKPYYTELRFDGSKQSSAQAKAKAKPNGGLDRVDGVSTARNKPQSRRSSTVAAINHSRGDPAQSRR